MKKTTRKRERSLQTPLTIIVDGEKEETTPSLPDDIIVDILLMLPVKSIIRFRCVCKNWRNWLSRDPSFIKRHLKNSIESGTFNCFSISRHQEFNILRGKSSSLTALQDDCFESINLLDFPLKSQLVKDPDILFDIHGSCNGLILMRSRTRRSRPRDINLCLWNPTTKEIKEIELDSEVKYGPACSQVLQVKQSKVTYGLGYDCETDDYKIVKANAFYDYDSNAQGVYCGSEVQVYTLGSDSWKTLPNIVPYKIVDSSTRASVNGALYWIATRCHSDTVQKSNLILSFDIKGENFREVPLPSQVIELFGFNSPVRRTTLSVLGGCLCVVFLGRNDTEVWVMKDHKVRESWTKLFVVQIAVKLIPIVVPYDIPMRTQEW
ncbi:F-box protein At3g07870-like [Papaver somniferum]|uniref:F-box protein At3g07870-like n=1 Tax=Papaver somniferum TaxID=3469 RepID=UPI000E6F67E9|nr:F-box protein At3g07870-like [Papaver somniferum]